MNGSWDSPELVRFNSQEKEKLTMTQLKKNFPSVFFSQLEGCF